MFHAAFFLSSGSITCRTRLFLTLRRSLRTIAAGELARPQDRPSSEAPQTFMTFPHLLDTLVVFIDAYLLTHRANRVAVVAALPDKSDFLYPPPVPAPPPSDPPNSEGPTKAPVIKLEKMVYEAACVQHATVAAVEGGQDGVDALKTNGATSKGPPLAPVSQPSGGSESERVSHAVTRGLQRLLAPTPAVALDGPEVSGPGARPSPRPGSRISQALSKSLCYIQRALRESPSLSARMLVLQASADAHGDYNAFMNCTFSAQRSSVPIDAAVFSSPSSVHKDSSFLQQASYITGGVYVRPDRPEALLQYFLHLFLPSHHLRQALRLPKQESVDFRAACFCHRKAVEQAYVCSVCLSIFCAFAPECATCGTPARPQKGSGKGAGRRSRD